MTFLRLGTLVLAVGSSLSPVGAMAADGPYVSVRGGLAQAQATGFDVGVTSAVVNGIQEKHHVGYEADVAAGFERGFLRVEAELSQRRSSLSSVYAASTATIPNSATSLTGKGFGTFSAPSGKTRVRAAMANVILSTTNRDIFEGGNLHFFGGGGVGYAWARAFNHRALDGAPTFLRAGTKSFAWQLIGGVRYDLDKHWSIDAQYKYFTATRLRYTDTANRRLAGSQTWNGFLVGVTYAF